MKQIAKFFGLSSDDYHSLEEKSDVQSDLERMKRQSFAISKEERDQRLSAFGSTRSTVNRRAVQRGTRTTEAGAFITRI